MNNKKIMNRKIATVLVLLGLAVGGACVSSSSAKTATVTLKKKQTTLKVTVANWKNTYGKTTIRLQKPKTVSVKKTTYRIANSRIASVSKKGVVKARLAGKTKVTVKVTYRIKGSKKNKTKKLTCKVTVKNKFTETLPRDGMQFDESGKAKPIFPVTPQTDDGNYSNEASYTSRFPVYVETDYDTDQDGKRDLIMAYVQVSRAATEGYYQAPVLFEANPYFTRGISTYALYNDIQGGAFDYTKLTASPAKRIPVSETTSAQAAKKASGFVNDMPDKAYYLGFIKEKDYYLSRGYAVVICQGPGSNADSEGIQLCAERTEAEDQAAVVEWLHGDRVAYADKNGTKLIKADFCNGHTAMKGLSYLGTLAYEVATLGVKGLDTVIPEGAIASWYDYVYSQGAITNLAVNYTAFLSQFCTSRFEFPYEDEPVTDPACQIYRNYLAQLNYDETRALGRYDEFWSRFAYHKGGNIQIPALLVEGLNDFNVASKHTMMMRRSFKNAGQTVKVLLHQGGHQTPGLARDGISEDRCYNDIVNRWLSHYLMGVENGVEDMKDFSIQSNVDGSWSFYDEKDINTVAQELRPKSDTGETTVSSTISENAAIAAFIREREQREKNGTCTVWEQAVSEDMTISGRGEVHLRAKLPDVRKNNPMLSVMLVDEADTEFDAYEYDRDAGVCVVHEAESDICADLGGKEIPMSEFKQTKTKVTLISIGWIDLLMPNAGWEPETCVAPDKPVENDTYHDYTVYLRPEHYTVKKGHRLKLYVTGFVNFDDNYQGEVTYTEDYSEKMSVLPLISGEYSFILENRNCYATIPVLRR